MITVKRLQVGQRFQFVGARQALGDDAAPVHEVVAGPWGAVARGYTVLEIRTNGARVRSWSGRSCTEVVVEGGA